MRKASASWHPGPLRCEVEVDGHVVAVDEPPGAGGTGTAPQPTDLFLASIASCFTLALAYSADKLGISLTRIDVDVVGHYDGLRFAAVDILPTVAGTRPIDRQRLLRGAERVCYVTNTLRSAVAVRIASGALLPDDDQPNDQVSAPTFR